MTTLAKVFLPNDYFPVGSFVEINDGEVQQVQMHQRNGRLHIGKAEGIIIPEHLVRQALWVILARGLDDQGAHAELRGQFRKKASPTNHFWENWCEETGEEA